MNLVSIVAMSSKILMGISGIALIWVLSKKVPIETQGYFFAFQSLISIQVFFELGLNQVLINSLSYEYARFRSAGSHINSVEYYRIAKVIQESIKLFAMGGIKFAIFSIPIGIIYFKTFEPTHSSALDWITPWCFAAICQALVIFLNPMFTIREASGEVADATIWKFAVELISNTVMLVAIYYELALYSIAFYLFARLVIIGIFLSVRNNFLSSIFNFFKCDTGEIKIWAEEIAPFKKKIALSWISGYLLFAAMPALTFASIGPVESGRFSLTWNVLFGLVSVSMALVAVNVKNFSALLAEFDLVALRTLFIRVARISLILTLFGIVIFLTIIGVPEAVPDIYLDRFLSFRSVALLGVIALVNQVVFVQAALIRISRTEPYLSMSILGGIVQAIIVIFGGSEYGVNGIVTLMTIWTLLVTLPWGYLIYSQNKPWSGKI